MADPHNIKRYGELWDPIRIELYLKELKYLKKYIILSGGWAWHFMSPKNHVEYKHAHDHKDADIFVDPPYSGLVIGILKSNGFKKTPTIHDTKEQKFIRYEKHIKHYKITFDVFFNYIPHIEIDGWKVIEPARLLSLYKSIHSTDNCWAIKAAYTLISNNENPVGRQELVTIPK